jgi:RHS repeat-associated protein
MMKQNMTYRSGDYLQKTYTPLIDKYIADYDAAGRLPGFANFNSTQTTYSYDNANRLTAINNLKADSTIISNYTFTLDGNGNRTNIDQTEPFAPAIGEGTAEYTYNTQKNRLLSTSAEGSFGYDDEGQLQTGYSTDYTFDYEHRLKTIGGTQFYYDGGGKRLKANRSGVETRYIYDAGGTLLAEADANNNITKYYIYGNGLLATVTPANDVYGYHYNGIGSTIAMTDNTQAVVNQYSYDVFGNVASEQEAITQPFKYVGQFGVMSEPNGFYYMRARYYDPKVGRFISEDPIGFDGGDVNLMAYVGNNPVNGIDPSGLYDDFMNTPMSDLDLGAAGIFYTPGYFGNVTNNYSNNIFNSADINIGTIDNFVSVSSITYNYLKVTKIATPAGAAIWGADVLLDKVSVGNNLFTPTSNTKTAIDTVLFTASAVTAATVSTFVSSAFALYASGRAGYSGGTFLQENLINGFYGDVFYNWFH